MPSSLEANSTPVTLTPTRRARQLSERAHPTPIPTPNSLYPLPTPN